MDIKSLYTVIPHQEGLLALKHFLDLRPDPQPDTSTLLRFAELVLSLNCFSFAGEFYHQIKGVAMGTRMGPNYANLFVGYVEAQIFSQYPGPLPELYGRYIDDCIGATTLPREQLDSFLSFVKSFHPSLEYTCTISQSSVAFLDILVSINNSTLTTSIHYKDTDTHSYLLYSSSHPNHTKLAIPYSQFLRLRRLCSDDHDFVTQSSTMARHFILRGYPPPHSYPHRPRPSALCGPRHSPHTPPPPYHHPPPIPPHLPPHHPPPPTHRSPSLQAPPVRPLHLTHIPRPTPPLV